MKKKIQNSFKVFWGIQHIKMILVKYWWFLFLIMEVAKQLAFLVSFTLEFTTPPKEKYTKW
jgi:hypothetical protein